MTEFVRFVFRAAGEAEDAGLPPFDGIIYSSAVHAGDCVVIFADNEACGGTAASTHPQLLAMEPSSVSRRDLAH